MVRKYWDKVVTSLRRILSKPDTINLLAIQDQGHSYTRSFRLSSESDLTDARELISMSHVLISGEDWQKVCRAGLAHQLLPQQESDGLYTPQQMEFAFMTLHNAEDA